LRLSIFNFGNFGDFGNRHHSRISSNFSFITQWLIHWAIRSAFFSLGLWTITPGAADVMQAGRPQETAAYERGERGALDPLTQDEQGFGP